MRRTTMAGLFLLVLLGFLFHESAVLGQQVYDLDVVAQTGVPLGSGTPVALGQGPSINDAGKVAFIVREVGKRERVMALNNGIAGHSAEEVK